MKHVSEIGGMSGGAEGTTGAHGDPPPSDVTLRTEGLPGWLDPVAHAAATLRGEQLSRFLPPENGAGRQSAVLILFGEEIGRAHV